MIHDFKEIAEIRSLGLIYSWHFFDCNFRPMDWCVLFLYFCAFYTCHVIEWPDILLTGCPEMHYGLIYCDEPGQIHRTAPDFGAGEKAITYHRCTDFYSS